MIDLVKENNEFLDGLNDTVKKMTINPTLFEKFDVKRGLRNADGTGVMAGITNVCCVHGYIVSEGEKTAIPGELIYRGYNINDIVNNIVNGDRYGYEEVIFLLLFGYLPTAKEYSKFREMLNEYEKLPDSFVDDMIIKAPSANIMNKLGRSLLALYSYDEDVEDATLEKELSIALKLIARLPSIMVSAYQVKRRYYDNQSMVIHQIAPNLSIAETILSLLRTDRQYTKEEAMLLDICLILHADHGGGNNSTFACRVLSSSGTDAYSAYSAAIGSLKGPKHGGANIKVNEMVEHIKNDIDDITDVLKVREYLYMIMDKKVADKSGLIYGLGHAVYTISDPRAKILRDSAKKLAVGTEFEDELILLELIEKIGPEVYLDKKGDGKAICANVDLYSGLVYKMLKIPADLFTPLFAISRITGWAAHRIEEITTGNRIIRPAYKAISKNREYIPIEERV